ncbi:MAG: hypothetical protein KF862_04545 [Chitinophagaceae bacterium]|nr:hypothetical protein [Chitinophagaceae bacterium]
MKGSVLLLTLAFVCISAFAQSDKEPFLTRALSGETLEKVKAETSGGSISVTGVPASEARIEIYIRPGNNSKLDKTEIQQMLDEHYALDIAVSNKQLTAIAKTKTRNLNWKKSLSISFKIYVDKNIHTSLATSGGSIILKSLSGRQDFATSGGSLHIDDLAGNIKGRTSGGSIHLENSSNEIDLATSGGSIEAKNCSGNIKLHTSGGSIGLYDLKGNIDAVTSGGSLKGETIDGDLHAHTSGGNVNMRSLSGSVDASTSGGNLAIEVLKLGKFVKLSNSGGNISLQVPRDQGVDLNLHANRISVDKLNNFSGSQDNGSISGTLNGGGVPVNVRAGSGRISLSLK